MSESPVNLAEERARREALPRHARLRRGIDHAARAWRLSPAEARAEAERYARMVERLDCGGDEPWSTVWRAVAEINRQRAAIYSRSAHARGKRAGAA